MLMSCSMSHQYGVYTDQFKVRQCFHEAEFKIWQMNMDYNKII